MLGSVLALHAARSALRSASERKRTIPVVSLALDTARTGFSRSHRSSFHPNLQTALSAARWRLTVAPLTVAPVRLVLRRLSVRRKPETASGVSLSSDRCPARSRQASRERRCLASSRLLAFIGRQSERYLSIK